MDAKTILPVLREYAPDDVYAQSVVYRPVADGLGLFLASVAPTESGTVGVNYLMARDVAANGIAETALFETAYANLTEGLRVNGVEDDGQTFLALEREGGFAASALGLPDFHAQAAEWLSAPRLFAGFTDPDTLFVAAADSPLAAKLQAAIAASDPSEDTIHLDPASYRLDGKSITRV